MSTAPTDTFPAPAGAAPAGSGVPAGGPEAAPAEHFSKSSLTSCARPAVHPRSRIDCFVPVPHADVGSAADIILGERPAGAPPCPSTLMIDLAFHRDGSIWGRAGAEPTAISDPADFIFDSGGDRTWRTSALPAAAAHRAASDTLDMIFGPFEAAAPGLSLHSRMLAAAG